MGGRGVLEYASTTRERERERERDRQTRVADRQTNRETEKMLVFAALLVRILNQSIFFTITGYTDEHSPCRITVPFNFLGEKKRAVSSSNPLKVQLTQACLGNEKRRRREKEEMKERRGEDEEKTKGGKEGDVV